jgi:hypothetical protein
MSIGKSNMSSINKGTLRGSEARRFGVGAFAVLGLVGVWLWLRKHHPVAGMAVAGSGGVVLGLALAAPAAALALRRVWMAVAGVIGWINSRIILGVVFFLILSPIAILRKLFGGDPLAMRWRPGQSSYWKRRDEPYDPNHFERPS